MTELTKEQLIEEAKLKIAIAKCHPNSGLARVDGELFKIALASLEAEPIAWECGENIILFNPDTVEAYAKRAEISPKPLYAASPVSVTPDGWISCSERMPKDGQHVIILCDGAFVLYAQYRDGEFFDVVRNGEEFFETQSRNVTHWMLLPEPPQEVN
ncbi:TPA: DUF551 domain-containing protein [Escherichia coli]|nr:DUF551 domain-containing protein [Escherichia coli]HBA8034206.1 DUF551 domain-containing protein [Escherichia coli]HBA9485395.1 DUF551 domain-containing protein [Escherichia coli]HBB0137014.1 DUF551 domain-containing protein [Escherichia coli]